MDQVVFKPNGTQRFKPQSRKATRLGLMLSALSLLTLTACETTSTATNKAAQCAAWRAIRYSAKSDSKPTVDQIRIHNQVGRNLGCW